MSLASISSPASPEGKLSAAQPSTLKEAFGQFVGETFYGQMIKSLRSSLDKPAYFHGGRAEEVFQSQLDQVMVEKLTESSVEKFAGPMFELFTLNRG